MTSPLGPRGPKDPTPTIGGGRVLPFPRRPSVEGAPVATGVAPTPPSPPSATPAPSSPDAATVSRGGPAAAPPAAPVDGAGASQVLARLKAMGIEGRKRVKTAEAPRVVDGADGRVHAGSLTVESRAGLGKLEGVTRLDGSLTLQEGAVKNADLLLALRDLKVVEGRLTFEGMRTA
jgi:hypothetical protein